MPSSLKRLIAHPLIKLAFSLTLLYFVFRQIDLRLVLATVVQAPVWSLIAFVMFWTALYCLCAWRWSLLIFQNPDRNQFVSCLKATFIGLFYNLVMPSAIGGDVIKWTALSRYNLSKKRLLFTVFMDRFIGLVGLIMAGVLAVVVGHQLHILKLPTPVIYALVAFSVCVGLAWLVLLLAGRLLRLTWLAEMKYFGQLLHYATTHRKTLLQAVAISILVQILANLSVYILARGLGFESNLLIFFVIEPIIAIITSLPISFAGLGTTEAVALYFFQAVGELPITILAFTTLLTIFRFVFGLAGWLVLVTEKKT